MTNNHKNGFALVTGASRGMGRAICVALAKEGYKIIACARNEDALIQLQRDISSDFPEAEVIVQPCDFSVLVEVKNLLAWIDSNALPVTILVNNVGLFIPGSILNEADDALHKHMQVNVFTPYLLSVHLGRMMKENKYGHIFNISSVASRNAVATAGSYSITKYALAGLTAVLREELNKYNVRVTEVIPGSTLTSSWEGTTLPEDHFVLPDDIAQAVVSVLKMSAGANVDEITIKPIKGQM